MVIFAIEMKRTIRRTFAPLAAAFYLLFAGHATASAQSATYMDALRAFQENRLAEAAKLFTREIAENPDNDAAYFYYADLLLSAKEGQDIPKIEENLKKAVALSPDNYWYKYTLALFYQQTERPELCAKLIEELIAAHPKKSDLYFDAAGAYLQQNDIDRAIASIDKISAIGGKNEAICMGKMDLLMKKDPSGKEAFAFLEEYYKDCKTPRMAAMLGDYYQQTYRDSLALARYNEALEMDSSYSPAYLGRSNVYQIRRDYDSFFSDIHHFIADPNMSAKTKTDYLNNMMEVPQFVAAFTPEIDSLFIEAHLAHPQDSALNNAMSIYYYRTDRTPYAIELTRQNAENYPESYTLGFQHMLMMYYCKAYNGVADYATVLLQKWPDKLDPLLVRANVFRILDNKEAAIIDLETFASKSPKDSVTIMQTAPSLGDLYFQTGQVGKSFKQYEKALKIDPENSLVLNNYAYFMSLGKIKLKKAQQMSKKTIEKEPDNPTYLDTYAWILHLLGQDVEAKAIFKHAMLYGGKESGAVLDHYAEVLFALKEYDLAFIYWNQAKSALVDEPEEVAKIEKKIAERKQTMKP